MNRTFRFLIMSFDATIVGTETATSVTTSAIRETNRMQISISVHSGHAPT
ncbi:MAG: hypothetical protein M1526_05340 [Candidatus Thermoplasmatota archaeon]|nr:hypothetical protein [Candidatus Thermoplasmatota archaeon]MCL5681276.1 hypothetical protein [Candidatus Thermoplasmatota archaeon]